MLSDTKNLLYFREKSLIMKQEQVTLYSNDGTLVGGRGRQDHFLQPSQTGKSLHASFLETTSQYIHYSSINILKILKSKLNVLTK
jgi:hypothetical protein